MTGTHIIDLHEIHNITLQIYNKYIDLSEYKYMQIKGLEYDESEFEKEIDELKSLLLEEFVLYDKYYQKWTPEEVEYIVSVETDKENLILERIQAKLLEVMYNPFTISREALTNLKKEYRIIVDKEEEKEIYLDILNELNTEKFTVDGPEIEVFKNFLTFLSIEMEKQENDDILKLLIMEFFFSIFSDPRLEEKMIDSKFEIDENLIMISDSLSLNSADYRIYKENLNEFISMKTNATLIEMIDEEGYEQYENVNFIEKILNTLGKIFNSNNEGENKYEYNDEAYLNSIDILLKCDLRAAMYVFSDKQFEKYVSFLNSVIKDNQNEHGVMLIKEAIEEARQDRWLFPKMVQQMNNTDLEKSEEKIWKLYEELIEYYKRKYSGEDVDSEIQIVIDKLKEERVIELSELKNELLEDFNEDELELYEQVSLSFKSRFETDETKARIMEMAKNFARYLSFKVMGYPERELYGINDDSLEVNKNILFFLDQAIACTKGDVRNFLIEFKFNFIYASYKLEEVALQTNFEITKQDLCFPSVIISGLDEKIDYYNQSKENIFEKLNIVLNEFHSLDKSLTPCMEGQIYKTISLFRGMLYTLGDKSYEIYLEALEMAFSELRDPITIQLMQAIAELSTLDRETYKKLIF